MMKIGRNISKILNGFVWLAIILPAYADKAPGMQVFEGSKYGYHIDYPATWKVYDHNDGVVVFKTQMNKDAYPATVNIQTIYTKKDQGSYATVKDLMDDFEKNADKHADNVKLLDRKPIT